jgi:hypothetical protein
LPPREDIINVLQESQFSAQSEWLWLDMVVHAFNSSIWEASLG